MNHLNRADMQISCNETFVILTSILIIRSN